MLTLKKQQEEAENFENIYAGMNFWNVWIDQLELTGRSWICVRLNKFPIWTPYNPQLNILNILNDIWKLNEKWKNAEMLKYAINCKINKANTLLMNHILLWV